MSSAPQGAASMNPVVLRQHLEFLQCRYSGAFDYYNFTTGAVHTCHDPHLYV